MLIRNVQDSLGNRAEPVDTTLLDGTTAQSLAAIRSSVAASEKMMVAKAVKEKAAAALLAAQTLKAELAKNKTVQTSSLQQRQHACEACDPTAGAAATWVATKYGF